MTTGAWLVFLLASGLGAVARWLLDGWVHGRTPGAFPTGTLVVNTSGCLLLGVVVGLGLHHGLDATHRTVLGTGGLGAFTTFSTFTWETVRLADEGATVAALANVALGMGLGLGAAAVGLGLASIG